MSAAAVAFGDVRGVKEEMGRGDKGWVTTGWGQQAEDVRHRTKGWDKADWGRHHPEEMGWDRGDKGWDGQKGRHLKATSTPRG